VLVKGGQHTTVSGERDAFADRMVTDSKVLTCGTSRIAYSSASLATTPKPPPDFLVRLTWWREMSVENYEIHAGAHSVSQVSVKHEEIRIFPVLFFRELRVSLALAS